MKPATRIRYVFGSKRRDSVWYGGAWRAKAVGLGHATRGPGGWTPVCPHCELPVLPTDPWDECHVGAPKALGGKRVTPGHRPCNARDNNLVVTPMVAKAKRLAAIAAGRKGPGLGRYPMRAGRYSTETKTMRGGVRKRQTLAQKHARMLERLAVVQEEA